MYWKKYRKKVKKRKMNTTELSLLAKQIGLDEKMAHEIQDRLALV